jgi:hypothetical protein
LHETASTSGETYGGKSVNQVIRHYENNCQNMGHEHNIGIATGNWGCGAFGGDPEIKTMIQWLAASQVILCLQLSKTKGNKGHLFFFLPFFYKECCISSDKIHIMYFLFSDICALSID